MKRISCLAIAAAAMLTLQGCVVVVGTDGDDGVYWGGRDYTENGVRHDGERLSRDVARTLGSDAELIGEDIKVSSEDGTVYLKGRVASVALLEKAMAGARGVAGVERVVSKLVVDAG